MKQILIRFQIIIFSTIISAHAFGESLCSLLPNLAKKPAFNRQLTVHDRADYILVDKSHRILHLFNENGLLKPYRVALGKKPVGAKRCSGDGKTPEGIYHIQFKNTQSDYHLSLKVNYPSADDIQESKKIGCDPGGDIMVHGLPNDPFKRLFINHPKDWTQGCVAVTNKEIEEIFDAVDGGINIEICK